MAPFLIRYLYNLLKKGNNLINYKKENNKTIRIWLNWEVFRTMTYVDFLCFTLSTRVITDVLAKSFPIIMSGTFMRDQHWWINGSLSKIITFKIEVISQTLKWLSLVQHQHWLLVFVESCSKLFTSSVSGQKVPMGENY